MHISVAYDFSSLPQGRSRADGPGSAESFLEDVLLPALAASDRVVIDMDRTCGYSFNWLNGVFGNLAQRIGVSPQEAARRVSIATTSKVLAYRVGRLLN